MGWYLKGREEGRGGGGFIEGYFIITEQRRGRWRGGGGLERKKEIDGG